MPPRNSADFLAAVKKAAADRPQKKRLTWAHVRVAEALVASPTPSPTHRQLAGATGLCVRTVQRALARMRALGLLDWTRRVIAGPGWRAQISNTYACLPSKPVLSFLVLRTSAKLSLSGATAAAPHARSEAEALAAIAKTRQAALAAAWAARKRRG